MFGTKLKELRNEFGEEELDVDYVDGVILELQGENLKAIEKFEQSYIVISWVSLLYSPNTEDTCSS